MLVPGDTNESDDIFVHDRKTGKTTRVSVKSNGEQVVGSSFYPSISADGRYVAFDSRADKLVPGDTNGQVDAFVHDRKTGTTTLVGVDSAGKQGNGGSDFPSISADGRYVAFDSFASNLVPGDTNGQPDIFVRDRLLKTSQSADLQLTVSSQPASVQNGRPARYIFTIRNNGPDSVGAVTLIDSVSGGKGSLTPSQGYCTIAAVSVCRLRALAAGASATVSIAFKAKGNPLTQRLSDSAAAPVDSQPANNSLIVSTTVTP
jgi:uncharacterized repeat protein (TIGR01451 family)